MHILNFLYPALLALSGVSALRSASKIKLSTIQSLTLRKDKLTSHRRVPALPQLKCIGGSARGLYDVDIMRCKNAGADYNEEDIQWTCTASLPDEFKLGSTDVICEGYESPDDPWVLKGSCGVEYRLVLTDKGREKYGKDRGGWGDDTSGKYPKTMGERVAAAFFWMLFIGVALWIAYNIFQGWRNAPAAGAGGGNRPGWGGGGGGWGAGNDDDPPPPYDYRPQPKQEYGSTDRSWRPGFWTGATGGAAAGYAAGRGWGNRSNNAGSGSSWYNGEGNSRSSSGSSSFSSTRHESTGFGSTSRR